MSIITDLGRLAINPRGDFDPSQTYNRLDLVRYENSLYVAVKDTTNSPDSEDWMLSFQGFELPEGDGFDSGTRSLFLQTTAPNGWTKDLEHNNKALRIVNDAVGFGGSIPFTTLFSTSTAITGSVSATTLTEAQMPYHQHITPCGENNTSWAPWGVAGSGKSYYGFGKGSDWDNYRYYTSPTGGNGSHTHSLTSASVNLDIQYIDAIICVKD